MAKLGKRTVTARKNIDRNKVYDLESAVKILKTNAKAKFDETIELALNLGVDPRHSDQMVRGVCDLAKRYGAQYAFVWQCLHGVTRLKKLGKAGADIVGAEELG